MRPVGLLCPFAFNRFQAARIKLQQLGNVLFRLGSRGAAEARSARCGTAYPRGSGNKLEQIESDIFIAAGAKTRIIKGGFHAESSPKGMLPDEGALAPKAGHVQRTRYPKKMRGLHASILIS